AAFGFDIEGAYYPFTSSGASEIRTDRVSAVYNPIWKPFVMIGYHARQFQSVSTQYNGFGIGLGFERVLTARYNLKGLLRYATLAGANDGKGTEMVMLIGLTFNL